MWNLLPFSSLFALYFRIALSMSEEEPERLTAPPDAEWLRNNYNRLLRPNSRDNAVVQVETFLRVNNIGKITEATMTYDIDLYLREKWHDPRLVMVTHGNESEIKKLTLHDSLTKHLWVPDTFLPNAVMNPETQPSSHSVTHRTQLRYWSDGHLLQSRRFSLTVHCPMDLTLYPFDRQVCRLSLESYGHELNDLEYFWKKDVPVTINEEMEMPDFLLTEFITARRNISVATDLSTVFQGVFSRLECCFVFQRRWGFYFMVSFFPATGIVTISWIALLMSKENSFSDIIQVVLALIFLNFSQNAVMPKVNYIKAIDVFIQTCFLFIFLSLLKLGLEKRLEAKAALLSNSSSNNNGIIANVEGRVCNCLTICRRLMSVLFPLMFCIFCTVYFVTYFLLASQKLSTKCA